MPQLSDDCFAHGGGAMTIDEALALFRARVAPVAETEAVPLAEADGRVLAADIHARAALPPFDNSAVDGYAVRHADLIPDRDSRLAVVDRLQAGDAAGTLAPGTAVRIFTGAPMPAGADTVYMQEDVEARDGIAILPPGLARGANRRPAGEEIAAGAMALPAGTRLRPQEIALAAGIGLDRLTVRRRLRVAIFSTGNELVEPGAVRGPAQVFDTNRLLLAGLLGRLGIAVSDLGILRDEPAGLAAALRAAAADHDLVLTTGGVSTGEADHVKPAVEASGRLDVWRFAIKPGRPLALGTVAGTAFCGLPGNPVAVYVTFTHIVRGLIAALGGEAWRRPRLMAARVGFNHKKRLGRTEFVRVTLADGPDGIPVASRFAIEGAAVIRSLTETDALMVLPDAVERIASGDLVGIVPLSDLG
jgi:molybdopterin molybdotransferase